MVNETNTNEKKTFSVRGIEIPSEYLHMLQGNAYIKLGGLLYLAQQMGTLRLVTTEIPNDAEIVYECKATLVPNKKYLDDMGIDTSTEFGQVLAKEIMNPVVMHGTCSSSNSQLFTKYARHMAETRSIARTLRVLTGCSMTAVEEMDKSDLSGSMRDMPPSKSPTVVSLDEMDMLTNANPSREEMIKVVYQYIDKAPFRKDIDLICKRHKTNALLPQEMTDGCLKEIYNACKARLNV